MTKRARRNPTNAQRVSTAWLLGASMLLLAAGPAQADIADDCASPKLAPAKVIAVCTQIIDSGRWPGAKANFARINRAIAYERLRKRASALADYDAVLELDPKRANAWAYRGELHARNDNFKQAISDFSAAIKLKPKFEYALGNRGSAYADSGKPRLAIDDFTRALAIDPDDSEWTFERASAHRDMDQHVRSVEDFDRYIELKPDEPKGYNMRAYARLETGDTRGALMDAAHVVDLRPESGDYADTHGDMLCRNEKVYQAAAEWSRSRELSPRMAAYKLRQLKAAGFWEGDPDNDPLGEIAEKALLHWGRAGCPGL